MPLTACYSHYPAGLRLGLVASDCMTFDRNRLAHCELRDMLAEHSSVGSESIRLADTLAAHNDSIGTS